MDEIVDYEFELLFDLYSQADRASWEQTRLLMFAMLAPYRKKGSSNKPSDILPLPWDDNYKAMKKNDKPLTQEQVDMLRNRSEKIKSQMMDVIRNKKKKKKHGKR